MSNVLSCVFRSSKLLWLATLSDHSWNPTNQSFALWWSRFTSTYLSWLFDIWRGTRTSSMLNGLMEMQISMNKHKSSILEIKSDWEANYLQAAWVVRIDCIVSCSTKEEIHRVVLFAFGRDWLYQTNPSFASDLSEVSLLFASCWFSLGLQAPKHCLVFRMFESKNEEYS